MNFNLNCGKKFILTKSKNDEYQFNLHSTNGQVILTSEGYTTNAGCNNGISSVKNNAALGSRYDRKIATNGDYYFNLKAGNGEIIGTSQMYTSIYSRENGIESVKSNALDAIIIDETS